MIEFFKKEKDKNKDKKEFTNIEDVVKYMESLEKKVEKLSKELAETKKEAKFALQKIGVVRFNPFNQIGGDQSFSVALLDADKNGVVITGIFSREGNNVYAKPIEKGESKYSLTGEEREAIGKATSN